MEETNKYSASCKEKDSKAGDSTQNLIGDGDGDGVGHSVGVGDGHGEGCNSLEP